MKLPVISKKSKFPYYPIDKICPICGTDRTTLDSEFYVLNGGALKKIDTETYTHDENAIGFLNFAYHPAINSKRLGKTIDVIEYSKNGQFDIYFCSINCMRTFFDLIIREIETQANK